MAGRKGLKMSAAARKKISEAMRAKWAVKKNQATLIINNLSDIQKTVTEEQIPTRYEQLRSALRHIEFSFTIFFTNEAGEKAKFSQSLYIENEPAEKRKVEQSC